MVGRTRPKTPENENFFFSLSSLIYFTYFLSRCSPSHSRTECSKTHTIYEACKDTPLVCMTSFASMDSLQEENKATIKYQ